MPRRDRARPPVASLRRLSSCVFSGTRRPRRAGPPHSAGNGRSPPVARSRSRSGRTAGIASRVRGSSARSRLHRTGPSAALRGGKEVPILVQRGAIEFYGQGLDTARRTRARTGWSGGAGGLPHRRRRSKAAASGFARSFRSTLDRKYRTSVLDAPERRSAELLRSTRSTRGRQRSSSGAGLAGRSGIARLVVQGLSAKDHRSRYGLTAERRGIAFGPRLTSRDGSRFRVACSMSERTS